MGCELLLGQPSAARQATLDREIEYFLRQFDMAMRTLPVHRFHAILIS